MVASWDNMAKWTVGKQLVRAADSIGANIAEGVGRGSYQDNRRFVRMARGSLNETRHWLRRAYRRKLLSERQVSALKPLIDELGPRLNAYLPSIGPVAARKNNKDRPDGNGGGDQRTPGNKQQMTSDQ
jgi:four helix bundle protein